MLFPHGLLVLSLRRYSLGGGVKSSLFDSGDGFIGLPLRQLVWAICARTLVGLAFGLAAPFLQISREVMSCLQVRPHGGDSGFGSCARKRRNLEEPAVALKYDTCGKRKVVKTLKRRMKKQRKELVKR